MKISISIPQYNRINHLLRSLEIIEKQTYPDIEIVISDDCSSDDTESKIRELIPNYKYPIIYSRNSKNEGYDRNYRKCIELSSGDYAFVIGNDDSIYGEKSIAFLVDFLNKNDLPDIGFCNMIEERTDNTLVERALSTTVLGKGPDIAMKYYSCFSFVGGLIYKKGTFHQFNTNKFDGSIYSQMYLGVLIISSGYRLFSIKEPLVLKDLMLDGKFRHSYRDRIAKKWKDFRIVDGGLPSVMNVLINGLKDAGELTQNRAAYIFRRMYTITYPHWILDYKENNAFPEAIGLLVGMYPNKNKNFGILNTSNKVITLFIYLFYSVLALLTPVFLFKRFKSQLYKFFKK